jgi:hypothetical protein
MARILLEVPVAADPPTILAALDSAEGIAAFWTDDVDFPGGVGSQFKVGFENAPLPFDLTITEVSEDTIRWTGGEFPPHWAGTEVIWTLTPGPEPATTVRLAHEGWASEDGMFAFSVYVWGDVLRRLKNYLEHGVRDPLSSGTNRTQAL